MNTTYRFDLAERILSLDSDFLSPTFPGYVRYAREFICATASHGKDREMNRLYVVETTPSNTGAIADHTWVVKPSEFEAIARAIGAAATAQSTPAPSSVHVDRSARSRSATTPGREHRRRRRKSTAVYSRAGPRDEQRARQRWQDSLLHGSTRSQFSRSNTIVTRSGWRYRGRSVDLLVIIGGNPAYNTPIDLRLIPSGSIK